MYQKPRFYSGVFGLLNIFRYENSPQNGLSLNGFLNPKYQVEPVRANCSVGVARRPVGSFDEPNSHVDALQPEGFPGFVPG